MVEIIKSYKLKNGKICTIRNARSEDAKEVVDCINSVGEEKIYIVIERFAHSVEWESRFIDSIDTNVSLYLVALVDDKIIGILSLDRENFVKLDHVATLGMIIIKPYRKVGAGSALLNVAIEWAYDKNIEKIMLSCFSTNEAALALYKKFDFIFEGLRKKQFKIGEKYVDEVMMARWLV
jgi:RimJ/RimL family protein N-acetyltransferase